MTDFLRLIAILAAICILCFAANAQDAEPVEVNAIERNAEVDARGKKADEAIVAAKKEGKDVTAQELECILTGVCG